MILECTYLEDHEHEYPDDWVFGGADGCHPGADSRFEPTSYYYYSQAMQLLHVTSIPTCDEEALDMFTIVGEYGKAFTPYYLLARRPGQAKAEAVQWWYDKARDAIYPLGA